MVRFPDGMRDRIRDAADANGRSMNAEIIHRLKETLDMDAYEPVENIHSDPIETELTPTQKRILKKLMEKLEAEDLDSDGK